MPGKLVIKMYELMMETKAQMEIRLGDSTYDLREVAQEKQSEINLNIKPSQIPQNIVSQ